MEDRRGRYAQEMWLRVCRTSACRQTFVNRNSFHFTYLFFHLISFLISVKRWKQILGLLRRNANDYFVICFPVDKFLLIKWANPYTRRCHVSVSFHLMQSFSFKKMNGKVGKRKKCHFGYFFIIYNSLSVYQRGCISS
jgi:hypothetical protein